MIDHQPRQQQPARIAAHVVDTVRLPGERNGAGDVIEQAGGTTGVGLVLDLPATSRAKPTARSTRPRRLSRQACGTEALSSSRACRSADSADFRAVAANRAAERIDSDDVAGAFPDGAEMRIAQQPWRGKFLDVANAAAHLERIATDFSRITGRAKFEGRS